MTASSPGSPLDADPLGEVRRDRIASSPENFGASGTYAAGGGGCKVLKILRWLPELVFRPLTVYSWFGWSVDIELLEEHGPQLGRPLEDTVVSSRHRNMKELRPGSSGRSELRILFAFDPRRQAILLIAGDKAGDWVRW
ncbi:type II toxin-antitoxin system RelE/ParE family toxin [Mycetocola tolaasinivorans]|uniref:type II toxin-antitoxin system RelE/ParE family toxin n=1 Tax=Mycetocola tolaasinivorans TaxID=76635 RepID=UPI003CCC777D